MALDHSHAGCLNAGMGLDAVEMVIAVEETFDIHIDDAEAEKTLTPRQLIELVQNKVSAATASVCLTQRAFNLLRKSLLHNGTWKRSDIAPPVRLETLIPRDQRRTLLEKVTTELGIHTPPQLVAPRWMNISALAGSLLAGTFAALAYGHFDNSLFVGIFLIVSIGTGGIVLRLIRPFHKEFPANLQTVGDLARWVMTHKGDLANATTPGWTREQIAARVREIVVDAIGCKPDFSEDANFVKDLGMG